MENEQLMKTASPWKLIRKMCIPTVIITLVMAIYNMTDIFFVGQTGNDQMVSALSVCMPIFMVIQAFGTLIGNGGGVAISIALGQNNLEKVKKVSAFCFYSSIFVGIVIAVLGNIFADQIISILGCAEEYRAFATDYLRVICAGAIIMVFTYAFVNIMRADGSAKESMIVNLAGTFTNMILDPIFILVLNLGPAGAAIATVLGNAVTLLLVLRHIRKNPNFSLSTRDFTLSPDISLETLKLGLPTALGTLLISVAYTIMNNILVQIDPNATGAFGVCRNLMLFSTMIQMGICMGIQPAVSYNYGRKDKKRVKDITLKTALVSVCFGVIVAILCIGFKENLLRAFLSDEQTLALARELIVGCLITAPVYGIYQMCCVYLQATDKAWSGTILTLLRQGIILIPAMYILNSLGGFSALAYSFAVTDVIAVIIGIILCKNYSRSNI